MDLLNNKPFGTINQELLKAKLHASWLSKDSWKIFLSYLSDRWQRTKVYLQIQFLVRITTGCTTVLRPILFNIHINDLSYILTIDSCNFANNTSPYVCNSSLEFVFEKLEEYSLLANEWFE